MARRHFADSEEGESGVDLMENIYIFDDITTLMKRGRVAVFITPPRRVHSRFGQISDLFPVLPIFII